MVQGVEIQVLVSSTSTLVGLFKTVFRTLFCIYSSDIYFETEVYSWLSNICVGNSCDAIVVPEKRLLVEIGCHLRRGDVALLG